MSNEPVTQKRTPKSLPEDMQKLWMTIEEAAAAMATTRWTIHDFIRDGVLDRHPERYLGRVLVSRASVEKEINKFLVPVATKKKAPKKAARR